MYDFHIASGSVHNGMTRCRLELLEYYFYLQVLSELSVALIYFLFFYFTISPLELMA